MGLLLNIIATLLKWVLSPILYVYGTIRSISKKEGSKYNRDIAIAKDQYGNVSGQYLFNDILILKGGYEFGNPDETISSVIGKNYKNNSLSLLGRAFRLLLDTLDPDHSINAIEEEEGKIEN